MSDSGLSMVHKLELNHLKSWLAGRIMCAKCYEGRKGRSFHAGHCGFRRKPPAREVNDMGVSRRKGSGEGIANSGGIVRDEFMSKKFPLLFSHLTDSKFEDGEARQTSTILVFVEQGVWKACFRDRDEDEVCFVTAGTLLGLWEALDKGLGDGGLDWRPSKPLPPSRGRR